MEEESLKTQMELKGLKQYPRELGGLKQFPAYTPCRSCKKTGVITGPDLRPYKCPVCDGRTVVPEGFYPDRR
jgi:DnaJ-class molecular chaperone